ncbi:NLR family CARD domain-containing protein 3 isoform X2 [Labeo rohita]|uniref:NLR family CARD domain-containing protein 3 isoform X2 n=1 Tax=Labeo rohita TaxID=84645 RepID=UPI0021E2B401|nr:NLR family CARD domain-containing protein 3 isoform X2 [Labeo rohita]
MEDTQTFSDGDFSPGCSKLCERSNSPEPSCVSMKSVESMDVPLKFAEGNTPTDLSRFQKERSNSPEPSYVSMKSVESMDVPLKFAGKYTSTDPSRFQKERSNQPEPSSVSMKSGESMDIPLKFAGRRTSTDPSQFQREQSNQPEPSCVSMKSDESMDVPLKFAGRHPSTDPKYNVSVWINCRFQKERSNQPEPSSVSMKSGESMDVPLKFAGRHTSTDPSQFQREQTSQPEPSSVSMNSGESMDIPLKFAGRRTSTDMSQFQREQSNPPEPSCVSMKSDKSMDIPFKFAGRRRSADPRKKSIPQEQRCESMEGDRPRAMFMLTNKGESIPRFKSSLLKKFQCLCEGIAKQGNPTLLNEIYTELYITESESGEISNEHEVRQIETKSRRAATEDKPIKCKNIFRLLPGQDKAIRTVLTKGVAGIGKTVSVQKFMVDWAEGKENQNIQLIFPLPFRELNLMKDKKLSLSDLLHIFFPDTKEMNISCDEYNLLLIFDGLDECRLSLDFQSNVRLCYVGESASVDVLLTNLIVGNLLPSALIWITSRPAAADLIPSECVHRVTEVRGFNDPQKEKYFSKRISDQSLANTIITHLKSSKSLYIMCHIPVFCWISATVLEKMLSEAESGEIPKTLTQMYTHFLIIQTNIKHEKDYEKKVKDEDMIVRLGKLAFQQLVKGNLIFYEEDLRECGIDETEASVYSGLCTQIFREEFGLNLWKVFCFVHLSIQEHLAALYAHFSFTNYNISVFDQTKESLLSKVLNQKKCNLISELHMRAVNEALQSKNGHLDLFLRFLLGLSLESNHALLQKLLTQTGSCSYNKEETVQYIKQSIRENHSPERSINLFHCLNELGDRSLMQEIQDYLRSGKIGKTKLSSSQWSALVYVLLTSEEEMDVFTLKDFIGAQNRADEVLQKLLPVVKECRFAYLSSCGVTDEGCAALASAMRSNPSHLQSVDLTGNKLRASGVNLLSDGLKDPHCKVKNLC